MIQIHFEAKQFNTKWKDGAKRLRPDAFTSIFHHRSLKPARKAPAV